MKIGLLAAAALLAAGALVTAALGAGAEGLFEEGSADSFSYQGCDELIVEKGAVFSVEVTGGPGSAIEAEVVRPRDSGLEVKRERSGRSLRLWVERRPAWFAWSPGEHRLSLRVPRDCRVAVETDTGSINVEGLRGAQRLRTDTGRITVRECRGEIRAESDTGGLVFSRVEGDLQAGSDTGGIVLSEFRGRLDLRSDTGSLEGRFVELTADCQLATDTGSIDFELERGLEDLAFELSSDTGLLWVGSAKGRKRLALGGGPLKVRARSDTGSISFR
jgi:hypothetical protein